MAATYYRGIREKKNSRRNLESKNIIRKILFYCKVVKGAITLYMNQKGPSFSPAIWSQFHFDAGATIFKL